jgi:hypothetical protein
MQKYKEVPYGEETYRVFKNIWLSSKNRAGGPFKNIR